MSYDATWPVFCISSLSKTVDSIEGSALKRTGITFENNYAWDEGSTLMPDRSILESGWVRLSQFQAVGTLEPKCNGMGH